MAMFFRCLACHHRFAHKYDIILMGARSEPHCPRCGLPFWVRRDD